MSVALDDAPSDLALLRDFAIIGTGRADVDRALVNVIDGVEARLTAAALAAATRAAPGDDDAPLPTDADAPIDLVEASKPAIPRGVWIGTMAELDALDLAPAVAIGSLGPIPLIASERTLLNGSSGVSKTLLAMRAACEAVLAGHTVVFVEGEGSQRATRDRFRRIARGLTPDGLGDASTRLHIVHGAFGLEEEHAMWRELLERVRPSIVVIDPLAGYFRGNENDAGDMGAFLRAASVAVEVGAAVVLVHHATKPDAEGKTRERGSGALRAWADTMISLYPGEQHGDVFLKHEKGRDCEPTAAPQALHWTFTEQTIELRTSEAARDAVLSATTRKLQTTILGLLADRGEMTRTELRQQIGKSGKVLGNLLAPLLADRRVIESTSGRPDTIGRRTTVEVLTLGTRGHADVSLRRADTAPDGEGGES